ncbi:MAG: FAD-dependent oxidoreductase, partial [Leisingera sp.]
MPGEQLLHYYLERARGGAAMIVVEPQPMHDRTLSLDYISGGYIDYDKVMPIFAHGEKLTAGFTAALKQELQNSAVISESQIRTPENAEAVIRAQQADLASIVRGQIADPFWVRKVAENRAGDVRGCISCNQMCWGRRSRDYWIFCLVNPSAGREHDWGSEDMPPAAARKKVLVIGAGPAGLEGARVAAERGHKVTLCEASDKTGGQFRLAGLQPRSGQIIALLDWYERQFERLGVNLRLNTLVEGGEVGGMAADEVVVATGALPAGTGFQRWLPQAETLPGLEHGG